MRPAGSPYAVFQRALKNGNFWVAASCRPRAPQGLPIRNPPRVLVYALVDDSLSRHLLGDSSEVFVRPEDAERFIEEVRGDEPELMKDLRIEERELRAGGQN